MIKFEKNFAAVVSLRIYMSYLRRIIFYIPKDGVKSKS